MLPSASAAGVADSDLLAFANEELQSWLVPLLLNARGDYLVFRDTQSTVAGTAAYRLPKRAVAGRVREVEIITASNAVRNLVQVSPDELEDWPTDTGTPSAFYLLNNAVMLVPTPSSVETLRISYYIRPNELTNTASDYATIATIGALNALTTSAAHGFTTSTVLDLVKANSAFEHLSIAVNASSASGSNISFTTLPTDIAVGDYICKAEKSPVPQIPAELHPILAQRVVVTLLQQAGDLDAMGAAMRQLDEMAEAMRQLLSPRVDGESRIVAPGSTGLMGDSWSWRVGRW